MTTEMTLSPGSIDRFRESLIARGRSENTVRAYVSDLKEFLGPAKEMTPSQFATLAPTWLNNHRKTWAPKTVERRLTALRAFARWAKMDCPDLDEYKPPSAGRPVPHPLPEGMDGVRRMVRACRDERQRALIGLCGMVGLRCSEALSVTPSGIDAAAMTVTVLGKGDKQRTVPLSEEAWATIAPAVATAVVTSRAYVVGYKDRFARQAITNAGVRAGLSRPVKSHDLRATLATAMYDHSLDLRAVQEHLGHSSSKTTEGYTGVSMDKMRGALPPAPPPEPDDDDEEW